MFCPRCGSEQVSDNVRFCSRCGFTLTGVAHLLAIGGEQQSYLSAGQPRQTLYRRITSQIGAKIVFLSAVMVPISFILAIVADSPGPFVLPVILFVLGFSQLAYSLIFGEPIPFQSDRSSQQVGPAPSRIGLPQLQGEPVPIFDYRRPDTAKISPPPSVTEPTTNLLTLDDDKKF